MVYLQKMLDQLETDCRKLNMRWIISCITDSNEESIAFHKKTWLYYVWGITFLWYEI